MTEPALAVLSVARLELARRLTVISEPDWENPTPCAEWNLRPLVNHVVGLHHRIARIVRGGSRDEFISTREDDWIGSDHMAAWDAGVRALDDAISNTRNLDFPVNYRIPLPARDALRLTAFDTAIHTWDVSRAIGFDDRLDDGLVYFALDFMEWLRSEHRLSFFDEPKEELDPRASAQDRLLYFAGREF